MPPLGGGRAGCGDHRTGLESIGDVVVYGNDDHLRQVFDILVENAVNYTDGDCVIEIDAIADGPLVTVTVSDDGPGMAAEEMELIFDRFHRGDDGGTGLGLAIARHVVESHGGMIGVGPRAGGGTTFAVELPKWFDEALTGQDPTGTDPTDDGQAMTVRR